MKIIIHHSGNHNTYEKIYDLHVNRYKWNDIGYHFLIENCGRIIIGRDINKEGAHCFGQNKDSIGICLLGNFDIEKPSKKQILALKKLCNELNINEIKLHRDYSKKTCPGKNFKRGLIRWILKRKN